MPVHLDEQRMQNVSQVKKRIGSTVVETKNHDQSIKFHQEDIFPHLEEDFKEQETTKRRKVEINFPRKSSKMDM